MTAARDSTPAHALHLLAGAVLAVALAIVMMFAAARCTRRWDQADHAKCRSSGDTYELKISPRRHTSDSSLSKTSDGMAVDFEYAS
jgi:hypothetical protein